MPRSAPIPGLVDREGLLQWARTVGARHQLPRLIRKLVLETGVGVTTVDFPASEGVSIGGVDGVVSATEQTQHVPAGLSIWELSAGRSTTAKATEDFNKRLATPDGSPTRKAVYCAISVRPWADRRTFAAGMAAIGRWREVRAYGVDDLETWLETAPATHAWISEQLGLHPYGRQTPERWWEAWARATSPALTTGIVLAGRSSAAADLRKRLSGPETVTTVSGPSVDDVLAFISAALIAEDGAESRLLERALIVDDVAAWRELAFSARPVILIAGSPAVAHEARAAGGQPVLVPLTIVAQSDIDLPRVDATAAIEELKAAGLDDERAAAAGRLARTSLQALRRHLASNPALHTAAWATGPSRVTRGILLAASWSDRSDGDQEVLVKLAGRAYEDLREDLTQLATGGDPLLVKIGARWSVVAPFDSWLQLRTHVRPDDLSRLAQVVQEVLLEPDHLLGLAPEERLRAELVGRTRKYSSELRAGLSRTLALLGTLGEKIDAGSSRTGSELAEGIVAGLLEAANSDPTGETWTSLALHLQAFAEAGPDAFLEAVRDGVTGDEPALEVLFTDGDDTTALERPSSPHPQLVWALERLAWSTTYFGQAVDLMARVAEIDPGGRLGRRPAESLAEVLCAWHPDTAARLESRIAALDGLRERHGDTAWRLMRALVPVPGAVHMPTATPQFRDWKPADVQVAEGDVLAFVAAVSERLVDDAGADMDRWEELISQIHTFAPDARAGARATLRSTIDGNAFHNEQRQQLWSGLTELVGRHREFATAAWALPSDEIDQFEQLAALVAPTEAVDRFAWLFQDHMPHLGDASRLDDISAYNETLARKRSEAVAVVDAEDGWDGILELAARATAAPETIGIALAEDGRTADEGQLITLLDADDQSGVALAWGYAVARFRMAGWEWLEPILKAGEDRTPRHLARLLLCTYDHPRDWEEAQSLGPEVEHEYWLGFRIHGLGHDYPYLTKTVGALINAERAVAAAELVAMYSQNPVVATADVAVTAADALDALAKPSKDAEPTRLTQYSLNELFELLERHKNTVGGTRLAELEWNYLPALGFEPSTPTLHGALSEDPAFFLEVLATVYPPSTGPKGAEHQPTDDGDTESQQAAATNAYRLLKSWRIPPGHNAGDQLNAAKLTAWIDAAMPMLRTSGHLEVGESHIGENLAWAAHDPDGMWPPKVIRDLLERLQSSRLEQGLTTATLNKRGATSRGLEAGGIQEGELAIRYRTDADAMADRWPRSAALLRRLAESYEQFGRLHEADAERWRQGLH